MASSYFRDNSQSYKSEQRRRKQDRLKPQSAQRPEPSIAPQAITPPSSLPTRGLQVVPGGRPQQQDGGPSDMERGIKTGLGALQKGLKPAGQLIDRFNTPGTFDRGASEPAFQEQRAGERNMSPYSGMPAMPEVIGRGMPGSAIDLGGNITGGGAVPPAGAEDWSNLFPGGGQMPAVSGELSSVAPGATGGMNIAAPSSGWTGSAGQIGGVAAAGLGGALSAYNLAQSIQAGNPMGIAQGALGTAVGAGAAAAAAGYAPAAAVMSAVAAPLAVAGPILMAAAAYMGEEDRKNLIEKLRQVNMRNSASAYEGGVNSASQTANATRDIISSLSPQGQQAFLSTAERLMAPSDQSNSTPYSPTPMSPLESIGQMRNSDAGPQQAPGTTGTYNELGTAAGKPYTELYKDLAYVMSQNPNLSIPSYNASKTNDINSTMALLNGQGGAAMPGDYQGYYGLIPGLPAPYVDQPASVAEISQGNTASTQVANPALNGQFSPEVLSSPFYAQEYWQSKGITPQMAMLYGLGQNVNNAQTDLAPHIQDSHGLETMTPEYLQQWYNPSNLYNYLTTQGGLSPVTSGATAPAGASQTGDMAAGGQNVGGAGKLSPTFATPELDRVAEISSAGKRQGPGMQQQQPGRPFGMGQPPQGGTFGQRGGMAVGQGPFGMARPNGPQIARNGNAGGNV